MLRLAILTLLVLAPFSALRADERAEQRLRFLASSLDVAISEIDKGDCQLPLLLETIAAMAGPVPKEGKKDPDKQIRIMVNAQAFKRIQKDFDPEQRMVRISQTLENIPLSALLDLVCDQVDAGYVLRKEFIEIVPISDLREELKHPGGLDRDFRTLVIRFFDDVPLQKALNELAVKHGRTVVLSPQAKKELEQKITARLINVPFDTAVETLAEMAELKVVRKRGVLMVTTPKHAATIEAERVKKLAIDKLLGASEKADEEQPVASVSPMYSGRLGEARLKLLKANGGNDEAEAAVTLGLAWLAKQQKPGGYWEFDGSHKDDRIAATGMSLLPLLAAGETHLDGKKYNQNVAKGLAYLRSQVKEDGQLGGVGMYSQAIGTMALCEAYGLTRDESVQRAAKLTIDYIVKGQADNGSWGYTHGTEGDSCILGWQIQALRSARMAGLYVPDRTMQKAERFLISVSDDSESRYGYRTKGSTYTLSAVGLYSRIAIDEVVGRPFMVRGLKNLWDEHKPVAGNWDTYYLYYAAQAAFFSGGKDWNERWNPALRKLMLEKQINSNTKGARESEFGSYSKDVGFIGASCGKLGTTALSLLILEVYYRNPAFKQSSEPKSEKK